MGLLTEAPVTTEGFAVTIKAVVPSAFGILLLRKESGRWDLPGGKLEHGETVGACLLREVEEETGLRVVVTDIVDSWVHARPHKSTKFVVTYLCRDVPADSDVRISDEHVEARWFQPEEIDILNMPDETKASVRAAMDGS